MKSIYLGLLKSRALKTNADYELFKLLINVNYIKFVEVRRDNLFLAQPILTSNSVGTEELEKIVEYRVGLLKVFLVDGDDNFFEFCKTLKWIGYSPSKGRYRKSKICPFLYIIVAH